MSSPFSGRASVQWGEPCRCHETAQENPPADPDIAGIGAVYDALGRAVVVGALATQLGISGGAELIDRAKSFADTSPTLNRAAETGGLFGAVKAGAGAVGKVWTRVEESAAAIWKRAVANPGLAISVMTVGGAIALGARYLSKEEATELQAIDNERAIVSETLARVSPEEAIAAVKSMQLVMRERDGMSWLAWAAIGVGLLILWRLIKPLLEDA